MTADEIRGVLKVLYIQGDAAVWDECWRDEDTQIVERWGPTLNAMNPETLASLKSLFNYYMIEE